jgi:sec-independent protein translocase protein TatB
MSKGLAQNMFGTLGGPELFLIFVVALIVFGPRKLPEIGKSLGRMMSEFRRASNDFRSTIESEVESEKIRESMRIEPPKVEKVKKKDTTTEPGGGPAPGAEGSAEADQGPKEAGSGAGASTAAAASPEGASGPSAESPSDDSASPTDAARKTTPATEPVPSTVSRQPPPRADEPK